MATLPDIDVEPFPELTPTPSLNIRSSDGQLHRRRKSSNLRGDPRGDTSGPALATLHDQSPTITAVNSPVWYRLVRLIISYLISTDTQARQISKTVEAEESQVVLQAMEDVFTEAHLAQSSYRVHHCCPHICR
jgi:hypothetical protein